MPYRPVAMPMRRLAGLRLWVLLPLLALGFSACGAPKRKVYCWKVRSRTTTVHLLGSVHVASPGLYPLDPSIESAFAASDGLVIEADIGLLGQLKGSVLALAKGMYWDGRTVADEVSPATLRKLKRRLPTMGLAYDGIKKFKPWMISLMLTLHHMTRLGYTPQHGIDKHFVDQARWVKPTRPLETIESQLAIFTDMTPAQAEAHLLSTLEELSESRTAMEAMFAAWRAGDLGFFEQMNREAAASRPVLAPVYEKLIDRRNEQMAARIGALLQKDQSSFVVVGAGHMPGERGILRLLEKQGYPVRQLAATRQGDTAKLQPTEKGPAP